MSNVDDILEFNDDGAILDAEDFNFNVATQQVQTEELRIESVLGNAVSLQVMSTSSAVVDYDYTLKLPSVMGNAGEALIVSNAATGELTWTAFGAPLDTQISIVGTSDILVPSGVFTTNQSVAQTINISLSDILVQSAASFGSATEVPVIFVDKKGRVNQAVTTAIDLQAITTALGSALVFPTTGLSVGTTSLTSTAFTSGTFSVSSAGAVAVGPLEITTGGRLTASNIAGLNVSGTDVAGSPLYVDGGYSTGSATGGNLIFRTTKPGATGTTTNPYTNHLIVNGNGNVALPQDSQELQLGASADLKLYHDGTDSYIDNATGNLNIRTTSNNYVAFFHNGVENLRTSATGISMSSIALNGSTSGAITLTAPAVTTSYSIAFPPTAGAPDQVLKLSSASELVFADIYKLTFSGSTVAEAVATGLQVTGRITGITDPINAQDAVSKSYADGLVNGLSWIEKADVATAAALTIGIALTIVDGVTISTLPAVVRILLLGQGGSITTPHVDNGMWDYNQATSAWSRPPDFPVGGQASNKTIYVDNGTLKGNGYTVGSTSSDIIGSDALAFTLFTNATFSVDNTSIIVSSSNISLNSVIPSIHRFSNRLYVGTTAPAVDHSRFEHITETNPNTDNGAGQHGLRTSYVHTGAVQADTGGSFLLCGRCDDATQDAHGLVQLAGRKFNATSGNFQGYLEIGVTSSSGTMSEIMRVGANGDVRIKGVASGTSYLEIDNPTIDSTNSWKIGTASSADFVIWKGDKTSLYDGYNSNRTSRFSLSSDDATTHVMSFHTDDVANMRLAAGASGAKQNAIFQLSNDGATNYNAYLALNANDRLDLVNSSDIQIATGSNTRMNITAGNQIEFYVNSTSYSAMFDASGFFVARDNGIRFESGDTSAHAVNIKGSSAATAATYSLILPDTVAADTTAVLAVSATSATETTLAFKAGVVNNSTDPNGSSVCLGTGSVCGAVQNVVLGYLASTGSAVLDSNSCVVIGQRAKAISPSALRNQITIDSIAIGSQAEAHDLYNICIGKNSKAKCGEYSIVIGTGSLSQGSSLGNGVVNSNYEGMNIILGSISAVGNSTTQADHSIVIGHKTICFLNNSIILDSSDAENYKYYQTSNGQTDSGFYVNPIKVVDPTASDQLRYNSATKEVIRTTRFVAGASVSTGTYQLTFDTAHYNAQHVNGELSVLQLPQVPNDSCIGLSITFNLGNGQASSSDRVTLKTFDATNGMYVQSSPGGFGNFRQTTTIPDNSFGRCTVIASNQSGNSPNWLVEIFTTPSEVNAPGPQFTGQTLSSSVTKAHGEILTTIVLDIRDVLASNTDQTIIGIAGTGFADITQITDAVNGYIYKAQMICTEMPNTLTDLDLMYADAPRNRDQQYSGAFQNPTILINTGGLTLYTVQEATVSGLSNKYIHLQTGAAGLGTAAQTSGKIILKFFGYEI